MGRFASLDVVRGVAALAVVIHHISCVVWPEGAPIGPYFALGHFAVAAFLLVSGFVIPLSIERSNSLFQFWIGRFFRLYPLYWFSLLIALFFYGAGWGVDWEERNSHATLNWSTWLANVTMLQTFVNQPHVLGPYWTLTLEMALYISCSLLFVCGALRQTNRLIWCGLALFGLLYVVLPTVSGRHVPFLQAVFLLLTSFFGTLLFRCISGETSWRQFSLQLTCLAAVSTLAMRANEHWLTSGQLLNCHRVLIAWIAAYALVITLVLRPREHYNKIVVWLGTISYSVYLLHPFALISLRPLIFIHSTTYGLACVILTIAVSSLTFVGLERPLIRLGKHLVLREQPALVARPIVERVDAG